MKQTVLEREFRLCIVRKYWMTWFNLIAESNKYQAYSGVKGGRLTRKTGDFTAIYELNH